MEDTADTAQLNEYTLEERRRYVFNKLTKEKHIQQLKCINKYLEDMMSQTIHTQVDYPWPMFEHISTDSYDLTKGFQSNFHVLYAEAEILKYLIGSDVQSKP